MAKGPYYGLEVSSGQDASVEVFMNGVPQAAKTAGSISAQSLAVQIDVVPNANVAEVVVGNGPMVAGLQRPTTLESVRADLFAVLKVQIDEVDANGAVFTTTTHDVAEASWRPSQGPPPVQLPHRLTVAFQAPSSTPRPSWLDGAVMTAQDVNAALRAELAELHDLLARKDLDAFTGAMALRYADHARAYPLNGDAAAVRADDLAGLTPIVNGPGFRMAPLPTSFVTRLHAGGRLVEAVDDMGAPVLNALTNDEPKGVPFPLLFSRLGGKLKVTR